MTVFETVTATISPPLNAYLKSKGKVWKNAFISSLQQLAGVEFSVYKKKRQSQIRGDLENIKRAYNLLVKVTLSEDWEKLSFVPPPKSGSNLNENSLNSSDIKPQENIQENDAENGERAWLRPKKENIDYDEDAVDLIEEVLSHYSCDSQDEKPKSTRKRKAGSVDEKQPQQPLNVDHLPTEEIKIKEEIIDEPEDIEEPDDDCEFPECSEFPESSDMPKSSEIPESNEVQESYANSSADNPATNQAMVEEYKKTDNSANKSKPNEAPDIPNKRKRGKPVKVEKRSPSNQSKSKTGPKSTSKKNSQKETIDDDAQIKDIFDRGNVEQPTEDSETTDSVDVSVEYMIVQGKQTRKLLQCTKCDFKCKSRGGLIDHKQRVHCNLKLVCPICNKIFGIRRELKRHIKRHTTQYPCEKCGKVYKIKWQFEEHLKKHEANYVPPQFSCTQCEKSFTTKYVLMTHVDQVHNGNIPEWLCTECGKKFRQKHSLQEHYLIHTGEKPFSCEICNKTFRYKSSLNSHLELHKGTRHFTCEVCGKEFKSGGSLRMHMITHSGTKNFECSVCNKRFSQKQALVRHERIHSGEKPFMCDLCGDRFNDNSILRRHMLGIHKITYKGRTEHFVYPTEHYTQMNKESSNQDHQASEENTEGRLRDNSAPVPSTYNKTPPEQDVRKECEYNPLLVNTPDYAPRHLGASLPAFAVHAMQSFQPFHHVAMPQPSNYSMNGAIPNMPGAPMRMAENSNPAANFAHYSPPKDISPGYPNESQSEPAKSAPDSSIHYDKMY